MHADGSLGGAGDGETVPIRPFVLRELERLRASGVTEMYLQTVARLLDRDPPFEPLVTFSFERPTLFGSASQVANNEAYGAVPESRVRASDNFVFGALGRFILSARPRTKRRASRTPGSS